MTRPHPRRFLDVARHPRTLWRALLAALALGAAPAGAQLGGAGGAVPPPEKLVTVAAAPVAIAAGGRAEAVLVLTIAPTWHINGNPASPDYMIATEAKLSGAAGITPAAAVYPEPHHMKVEFDDAPLSVYDGTARIRIPLSVAATAASGAHALAGTLRFQSCNDQVCLAPATIPFRVTVTVTGGATPTATTPGTADTAAGGDTRAPPGDTASAAGADTTLPLGAALSTAPPAASRGALLDNPLARRLESGSWGGFLTLFVIGLALNLTPCVYPMLGVTVSIFGARRAAPPLQVFGYALVYVLGIAVMYSALGLAAAFTGGLFGGALQSPWVLIGIGVLLAALALSMFGFYELQLPPALLQKLGGNTATGMAGTFLSGLLVGVFAAPCVGPPVVALLALVGAKGDPWFGFTSFFTLALGLGAPYLVLGTFSNLLQTLPRSGEWMIWVKKLFGVAMLSLAVFYASLALAPAVVPWIAPVALVVGGMYLGFVDRSGSTKPGFRRLKYLSGFVATALGVVAIVTMPRAGLAFEPYTAEAVAAAKSAGQPVMVDFTADWCAPCHELERFTFTDARVRDEAKRFRALRVDLTRYDSPEADRWRKEFGIIGVPTVLFLMPNGGEVRSARVESFLPPERFLERMRMVGGEAQSAEVD